MKKILTFLIEVYQKTISPDHSWVGCKLFPFGFCPTDPSCSEYSKLAIEKHGALKGTWMAIKKVVSCR